MKSLRCGKRAEAAESRRNQSTTMKSLRNESRVKDGQSHHHDGGGYAANCSLPGFKMSVVSAGSACTTVKTAANMSTMSINARQRGRQQPTKLPRKPAAAPTPLVRIEADEPMSGFFVPLTPRVTSALIAVASRPESGGAAATKCGSMSRRRAVEAHDASSHGSDVNSIHTIHKII